MSGHFNRDLFAASVRRHAEPYTLRELSELTGVSAATLSRIERDTTAPDVETLYALCAWMRLSPELFLLSAAPPAADAASASRAAALREIVAIALKELGQ